MQETMDKIEEKQYSSKIPPDVTDYTLQMTEFAMNTAHLECFEKPEGDEESSLEPVVSSYAGKLPDRHMGEGQDRTYGWRGQRGGYRDA